MTIPLGGLILTRRRETLIDELLWRAYGPRPFVFGWVRWRFEAIQ